MLRPTRATCGVMMNEQIFTIVFDFRKVPHTSDFVPQLSLVNNYAHIDTYEHTHTHTHTHIYIYIYIVESTKRPEKIFSWIKNMLNTVKLSRIKSKMKINDCHREVNIHTHTHIYIYIYIYNGKAFWPWSEWLFIFIFILIELFFAKDENVE